MNRNFVLDEAYSKIYEEGADAYHCFCDLWEGDIAEWNDNPIAAAKAVLRLARARSEEDHSKEIWLLDGSDIQDEPSCQ